MHYTI